MPNSGSYPSLERKPGKQNWVDKAGGLPSYIERIAKHLHYEQGYDIGRAIASAVNTAKRWCAGGEVTKSGSKSKVTAATKAKACKAVAEWEKKKAKGRVNAGGGPKWTDGEAIHLAVSQGFRMEAEDDARIRLSADEVEFDYDRYNLALAAARAEHGLNLAIQFDPAKHPRDYLGRFRDVLGGLDIGDSVLLPSGTTVTKGGDGNFVVNSQDPKEKPKAISSEGDAAKEALSSDVRSTEPNSLGGETSFKDLGEFVVNDMLKGDEAEKPPGEPQDVSEDIPGYEQGVETKLNDTFERIQVDSSGANHASFSLPGGDDEHREYFIGRAKDLEWVVTDTGPDDFVLTEIPFDAYGDDGDGELDFEQLTHHVLGTPDINEAVEKAYETLKDRVGSTSAAEPSGDGGGSDDREARVNDILGQILENEEYEDDEATEYGDTPTEKAIGVAIDTGYLGERLDEEFGEGVVDNYVWSEKGVEVDFTDGTTITWALPSEEQDSANLPPGTETTASPGNADALRQAIEEWSYSGGFESEDELESAYSEDGEAMFESLALETGGEIQSNIDGIAIVYPDGTKIQEAQGIDGVRTIQAVDASGNVTDSFPIASPFETEDGETDIAQQIAGDLAPTDEDDLLEAGTEIANEVAATPDLQDAYKRLTDEASEGTFTSGEELRNRWDELVKEEMGSGPAAPASAPGADAPDPASVPKGDPASPGRGPSGKLRNFKAMKDEKLTGTISDLVSWGDDPDALSVARAEAQSRGLTVAGGPATPTPKPAPPTAGDPNSKALGDPASPGRGPSGKMRNFKAMKEEKLQDTYEDLVYWADDPDALEAVRLEMKGRGLL